jgi:CubicO group peptidase (beta-lactamase class C family)
MAGAAGGGALVTTVSDLAKFLMSLRAGTLFNKPDIYKEMATFVDATGDGGRVGYGLGLEKYLFAGDVAMIGHLGSTAGYRAGTFYFPGLDLTMAFVISSQGDPTPVIGRP